MAADRLGPNSHSHLQPSASRLAGRTPSGAIELRSNWTCQRPCRFRALLSAPAPHAWRWRRGEKLRPLFLPSSPGSYSAQDLLEKPTLPSGRISRPFSSGQAATPLSVAVSRRWAPGCCAGASSRSTDRRTRRRARHRPARARPTPNHRRRP
ncbi:hypothetical protein T492DRAFT_67927 [Pavlovales sp. CCMP2436]|nr:hypothetical protein T492DRAFT_67927 [Pavlovales sp. CCMP2436]